MLNRNQANHHVSARTTTLYTNLQLKSVPIWQIKGEKWDTVNYLRSQYCRKGDPFQGPKLGSCLTLGNELFEETHLLTKQEILLGKGTQVESSRVRELRRTALPRGSQSPVLWWWVSFRVVFSQSFWLRVLPGGACLVQPRWMPERRILGGGWACGISFDLSWTLPVGGSLLVLCSLPGSPVIKQLMQMVTMVSGQGGRFQSVCFP